MTMTQKHCALSQSPSLISTERSLLQTRCSLFKFPEKTKQKTGEKKKEEKKHTPLFHKKKEKKDEGKRTGGESLWPRGGSVK